MSGFGGFPIVQGERLLVRDEAEAREAVVADGPLIPQGNCRSYGDACLGPRVASVRPMARVLSLDENEGVLRAEAGVTMGEVIDAVLPRGWFPPVTPGTMHCTLGGCVAADVHGKNHHVDGSFGRFVESLSMILPNGDAARCSRSERPELFQATIGGMGLTGIVVEVELRLRRVRSGYIDQRATRVRNLDECCDALEGALGEATYSVAWLDCIAGGASRGRGILLTGEHSDAEGLPGSGDPLAPARRRAKRVGPIRLGRVLNRYSIRLFNELYYRVPRASAAVSFEPFFYPLDVLDGWNRLYGKRGFLQYQFVVPFENGREVLREALDRIDRGTPGIFLAVLKTFGEQEGLLSFPMPGYTLAADIPRRGSKLEATLRDVNRLVCEAGGRIYLAKDAILDARDFETMYPRHEEFRAICAEVDPEGRFRSSLSDRVGLTR